MDASLTNYVIVDKIYWEGQWMAKKLFGSDTTN